MAVRSGLTVLCVTPYRAQAALLRKLGNAAGLRHDMFSASTIHRQQGTQYDVVLVDTVAGGRPFPPHTPRLLRLSSALPSASPCSPAAGGSKKFRRSNSIPGVPASQP